MGLGSFVKKTVGKVSGVINKVDPTGISSTLLTGGLNINARKGGMVGGIGRKLLGAGLGGGSGGQGPAPRKRYQRRKRNKWQSKRQKAFAAKNKPKKKSNSRSIISAGITARKK